MSFYSARYATRGRQKQLESMQTIIYARLFALGMLPAIIIWHKALKLTNFTVRSLSMNGHFFRRISIHLLFMNFSLIQHF